MAKKNTTVDTLVSRLEKHRPLQEEHEELLKMIAEFKEEVGELWPKSEEAAFAREDLLEALKEYQEN